MGNLLTDELWTEVRLKLFDISEIPEWIRQILSMPLEAVLQLPTGRDVQGLAQPHSEIIHVTESYLDFLRTQIELGARGPEWPAILKKRLASLAPYVNQEVLVLTLMYSDQPPTFRRSTLNFLLQPFSLLYWEVHEMIWT